MFKKVQQKIKESLALKIVVAVIILGLAFLYSRVYFSNGIYFEETFLKKSETANETHYRGTGGYGDFHITVKDKENHSKEVIYELPNGIEREYTVSFETDTNSFGRPVKILDKNGDILIEASYIKEQPFLMGNDGPILLDDEMIRITYNGESPFNEEYEVPLKLVVDTALYTNETIRGKFHFLFIALVILIVTAIDYMFPLFYFKLRNFLEVKDPEPSEFYLYMQRLSWKVMPVIGLVFLFIALI